MLLHSIIAITGLAGHAIGSWTNPASGRMWLRDDLPEDVPNARILTYGYASQLAGSNLSRSSLQDLANRFITNLVDMRDMTEQVSIALMMRSSLSADRYRARHGMLTEVCCTENKELTTIQPYHSHRS